MGSCPNNTRVIADDFKSVQVDAICRNINGQLKQASVTIPNLIHNGWRSCVTMLT